jgi:hypothetical protein
MLNPEYRHIVRRLENRRTVLTVIDDAKAKIDSKGTRANRSAFGRHLVGFASATFPDGLQAI